MVVEELTTLLIENFNPKFLAYDFIDNSINIVIAADCFINQPMNERVRSVYKTIEQKYPDALEKTPIFVHSFTEEELLQVLEHNIEGI